VLGPQNAGAAAGRSHRDPPDAAASTAEAPASAIPREPGPAASPPGGGGGGAGDGGGGDGAAAAAAAGSIAALASGAMSTVGRVWGFITDEAGAEAGAAAAAAPPAAPAEAPPLVSRADMQVAVSVLFAGGGPVRAPMSRESVLASACLHLWNMARTSCAHSVLLTCESGFSDLVQQAGLLRSRYYSPQRGVLACSLRCSSSVTATMLHVTFMLTARA